MAILSSSFIVLIPSTSHSFVISSTSSLSFSYSNLTLLALKFAKLPVKRLLQFSAIASLNAELCGEINTKVSAAVVFIRFASSNIASIVSLTFSTSLPPTSGTIIGGCGTTPQNTTLTSYHLNIKNNKKLNLILNNPILFRRTKKFTTNLKQ